MLNCLKWIGRLTVRSTAVITIIVLSLCPILVAQEYEPSGEGKYDLWIIDTHPVGDNDPDPRNARYLRLDDNCQWSLASEGDFLKSLCPSKSVNYVLPGYMSDLSLGIDQMWSYYHQLDRYAKTDGTRCHPTRVVLWAWPSERQGLAILRDARNKAARAEREGYWLCQHLSKLPSEYRANLLGHSLGARIATSAAHQLASMSPADNTPRTNSLRLTGTLIAPAVDSDWLDVGRPHQLALRRFEKLLLVNNSSDRVLKRYRLLNRSSQPEAVGAVGLKISDGQLARKVQQIDVNHIVGRVHHWHQHLESPTIMAAIAPIALFSESADRSAREFIRVDEN